MAGKLITLPLRVTFGSARLLTRAATGAAGRALSLAGRTVGVVAPGRSGTHRAHEPPFRAERERHEERFPAGRERHDDFRAPETPQAASPAPPRPEPEPAPPAPPAERRVPRAAREVRPAQPEPPAAQVPVHVSEEPELVGEFAEPGAEDGPGAAINVAEPWDGYQHMNARDVIERARAANRAELAAVRLYESRHRSRQTVLAAVDRQLRLGNGGAPA